ncbi:MAG: thioredoxin family protein [Pseudoxanthomonas sp.]
MRINRLMAVLMIACSLGLFALIAANRNVSPLARLGIVVPSSKSDLASLGTADTWLNSEALGAEKLQGKVVVVQFWTYTCINWLRTLPYARAWTDKYKQQGLVVIGVHTPEFEFEKDVDNVRRAIKQMGIGYPVAIDSDYSIWNAFNNQYWPALYFIDAQGRIRHQQFGEGDYAQSERMIQKLLAEAGGDVPTSLVAVKAHGAEVAADWASLKSGENYLGYGRTAHFVSPGGARPDHPRAYAAPARLALNQWALAGDWTMEKQFAVSNKPGGRISYRFHARDLHLVMGPATPGTTVRFRVSIDGKPPGAAHGTDVDEQGNGAITAQRLYQLIRQQQPVDDRTFEIDFTDPGAEAFAFTFG